MPWPDTLTNKTHISDSTQDPDLWRAELNSVHVDAHNTMVSGRGSADGVCPLDANALVPASSLNIVPIERGGTGATTQANARTNLQLGTTATLNAGVANGAATLDANAEAVQKPAGAAAAPPEYVFTAGLGYVASIPGANSISRTALKTASQYFDTSPGTGSWVNLTLAAGQWGLYPTLEAGSSGNRYTATLVNVNSSLGRQSRIAIFGDLQLGTPLMRGEQRYFVASPPYDFGDGEFEDFLFLQYRNGKLVSTYFAMDPPWANNGPTNIHNGIQRKPIEELADPEVGALYCEDLHNNKIEPVAEGMALKMYDMPLMPHPFDDAGYTVIVDPMGDEIRDIREFAYAGYSVREFLDAGQMTIDNEPLKRCGPPGVPVVRARWKRTR